MTDDARLVSFTVQRSGDGTPGYKLENPFGETVQVLPRPPSFRATVVFEWEGGMPEDVQALAERARAVGIDVRGHD